MHTYIYYVYIFVHIAQAIHTKALPLPQQAARLAARECAYIYIHIYIHTYIYVLSRQYSFHKFTDNGITITIAYAVHFSKSVAVEVVKVMPLLRSGDAITTGNTIGNAIPA